MDSTIRNSIFHKLYSHNYIQYFSKYVALRCTLSDNFNLLFKLISPSSLTHLVEKNSHAFLVFNYLENTIEK